jgi:hypothetical protein
MPNDTRYTIILKPQQIVDLELMQRFYQRSTKADVMALGVYVLKWMAGEIASRRPVGSLYDSGLFREAIVPHDDAARYPELLASAAILSAANRVPTPSRAKPVAIPDTCTGEEDEHDGTTTKRRTSNTARRAKSPKPAAGTRL